MIAKKPDKMLQEPNFCNSKFSYNNLVVLIKD